MIWFLTALSIGGVVLNVRKDRRGFLLWIVTNLSWAAVDFSHELYAQGVLFVVYFFLALWGLVSWKK